MDRLTKFAHFLSLTHPFFTQEMAQLFLDAVVKIHGVPKTILLDRDKIFTSTFGKNCSGLWESGCTC